MLTSSDEEAATDTEQQDGTAALLISQLFDAIDKDGSVSFFRLFGRVTARVSMTLLSSRVDWSLMLG